MSIKTKRILYITFIGLFIVIAPIALFHTAGYRWNVKTWKFEKTGTLVIVSLPKKSAIYLNQKKSQYTTPATIRFLLPDQYQITLKKNNYLDWTKHITVHSGITTFVTNTYLVQKPALRLLTTSSMAWIERNTRHNAFLFLENTDTGKMLSVLDLENNTSTPLFSFAQQSIVEPIGWSNNDQKMLLSHISGNPTEYYIAEISSKVVQKLQLPSSLTFEKIRWDGLSNTVLYGLRSGVLYRIDTITNAVEPVFAAYINDFVTQGPYVYFTKTADGQTTVERKNIHDDAPPNVITLPNQSRYTLALRRENTLEIHGYTNDFYIIDTNIFGKEKKNPQDQLLLNGDAERMEWSSDKNQLLYYGPHEMYTFDFTTKTKRIITRSSDPLTFASFALQNSYIVYATQNHVTISENTQGKKNIYPLFTFQSLQDLLPDEKKGNRLYALGSIDGSTGLYEITVGE